MTVERRTEACPPELNILHALAASIEGKVNLAHPDKILRVEVFAQRAALAVLAPDETFSVVTATTGEPAARPAPDADRTEEGAA